MRTRMFRGPTLRLLKPTATNSMNPSLGLALRALPIEDEGRVVLVGGRAFDLAGDNVAFEFTGVLDDDLVAVDFPGDGERDLAVMEGGVADGSLAHAAGNRAAEHAILEQQCGVNLSDVAIATLHGPGPAAGDIGGRGREGEETGGQESGQQAEGFHADDPNGLATQWKSISTRHAGRAMLPA